MRMRHAWGLLVSCSCLLGCPEKKQEPQEEAPAAAAAAVDAGTSSEFEGPLELRLVTELADGGSEVVIPTGGEAPVIEPAQVLHLTSSLPLRNVRIRVLDENERTLLSDDTQEDASATGLRYRIALKEPLTPGSRFTLVVEPQSGTAILGPEGGELTEQRVELATSGEKPPPPPPQKPAKRSRRR